VKGDHKGHEFNSGPQRDRHSRKTRRQEAERLNAIAKSTRRKTPARNDEMPQWLRAVWGELIRRSEADEPPGDPAALAKLIGADSCAVRNWVSGTSDPSVRNLERMLAALDLEVRRKD
jgi:hypothetical protein